MNLLSKLAFTFSMVALAVSTDMSAANSDGIKVEHLGTNNTLVRIDGQATRYLMLPVQEEYGDATVNILVDGKVENTIYVRLARNNVNYSVPLDLTPYKGHKLMLNIITPDNRPSLEQLKSDVCWSNLILTDTFDDSNREQYRPAFHHTPKHGWMNDPNGMFYKDGVWHLYFQHNPYGSKWQNMSWGHSTSTDLIHWESHPTAIKPSGLGSIFSGSCVIDKENTAGFGNNAILAMYTSCAASQIQSLAYSTDNGMTFTNYEGNPVITLGSEARDPNMFWNPKTKMWTLYLAHALEKEMLIFTSPDMKQWTLQSHFGKGIGAQGGVWECPDMFELPLAGTKKTKWVLICNINPGGPFGGSGVQYFVGEFDGKTFKADTDAKGNVSTKWLDHGKDNYALVSWSDAPNQRRTTIGWMNNWQYADRVPTMQYRSANTLPRDLKLFTAKDGQVYVASVPSPEVDKLRDTPSVNVASAAIGENATNYSLPQTGLCEIVMDIAPTKAKNVNLKMSNSVGDVVSMTYNVAKDELSFDRTKSGIVDFSPEFPAVTTAPVFTNGKVVKLRIFVDRSSIEAFANEGRGVMTNTVFPKKPYTSLSINADGGNAKINNLKVYEIKSE